MSEQQMSLPLGGAYSLTDETVSRLIRLGDGPAALLFLYLLQTGGRFSETGAQKVLSLPPQALAQAMDALRGAGLVAGDKPPEARGLITDTRPEYAAGEVAGGMSRDPAFRHVAEETERRLGKVLSSSDLQILFSIYDWRGLPPGVISLLVAHCVEESARRHGPGSRPPTMRQIDKTAAEWEAAGLFAEEAAEAHIHREELRRNAFGDIFRLLGITNRAPTKTEESYVAQWVGWGFGAEATYRAYDKTVVKTGGLHWKYMNSILQSWHEKDLHTLAEIESGDKPGQKAPAARGGAPGQHERDAVARVRESIEKGRKDGLSS